MNHMSTFKMGFKNLFVFTALLLVWKVCRVHGQAPRVEYINQPYPSSVATNIQGTPQLVVPAIYTPVISPYDSYIQESVPTVPCCNGLNGYYNYAPSYPQPMPPIIIEHDSKDNFNQILYFILFAMRNRRNCGSGNCGCCSCGCNGGGCNSGCKGNNGGYNGGYGCGPNSGGNCGGNCGGSGYSYVPCPIPYPMNCPYPYFFPGFGGYPDNSCSCIEDTCPPKGNNDINLYIITDSPGSS